MNPTGIFGAVALIVAAVGCSRMAHVQVPQTTLDEVRCVTVPRWRLPETDVVELTANDNRTEDELTTQARIDAILVAAVAYCVAEGGTYPASFDALAARAMSLPDSLRRCELDPTAHHDAWGRPIFFGVIGGRVHVQSAGKDGVFSTPDDIGVPEPASRFATAIRIPRDCD